MDGTCAVAEQGDDRGTVAGQRVVDVLTVGPSTTVREVRIEARTRPEASLSAVAVCESGRLRGVVTADRMIAAADDVRVDVLMATEPPTASTGETVELAAWRAVDAGWGLVAVVDEGRFGGIVPPERLCAGLLEAHRRDMARLSGFLHDVDAVRLVSQEPVARRLWHRLPWLLVGLAGALVAAGVMSRYEALLSANVLVALFVPGIVYLADAVGTQTETLIIRGLSAGVSVRAIALREMATGLLIAVVLAAAFFVAGVGVWGDVEVATAVALAIFTACSTATGIAMGLPALLRLAGLDPAFGSGPLATVVQDVLSILVYLAISSALVS